MLLIRLVICFISSCKVIVVICCAYYVAIGACMISDGEIRKCELYTDLFGKDLKALKVGLVGPGLKDEFRDLQKCNDVDTLRGRDDGVASE